MLRFQFQLDRFRRLFQRQWVEYALEVVFLSVGGLFLLGSGLDFLLWRWKFLEVPLVRWAFWVVTLTVLIRESEYLFRKFRKIPKTHFETFHFLRTMQARSVSSTVSVPLSLPRQLENALDFLERPQPAVGQELREAVILQTEREMAAFRSSDWLQMERFWRVRWLLRSLTALFLLGFGVLAAQCGENAPVAIERFVMPWKTETSWKIDFRPQWKAFPKEILEGETFDAEIVLQKGAPFIQVAVWDSEISLKPLQIQRVEPIFGRFLVRIPNIQNSFYISTFMPGEIPQTSRRLPVHVRTFPRLLNAILRLKAPASTHQKPIETSWEISGLAGSLAGVMIVANRPLQDAKLRFSNGTYVPGEPVFNGKERIFKFRFELLQDCDYWLELTDQDGLTATLERHPIRIIENQVPSVICADSEEARPFLPGAKLKLKFQVQDDFGLTSFGFRWIAEKPDAQAEGGFSFPKTKDGTPKWMVFSVWNAADPETGEIPDVPLPLSQTAEFTWNLTSVPLEAGMRLRVEAFATDSEEQRTFGETFYFNAVTPDAMQLRAFHQWLAITQELRRMGNQLVQCQKRLEEPFTSETVEETATFLSGTMGTIQRLLDAQSFDGLPAQIERLEEELTANPVFPFNGSTDSKAQLQNVLELKKTLEKLETGPLAELNQEIVFFIKSQEIPEKMTPETLREINARLKQKLAPLLQELAPMLNVWKREEYAEGMRSDFDELTQQFRKIIDSILPLCQQAENRSPVEIRLEYSAKLTTAEEQILAVHSGVEQFTRRYKEILEPEFWSEGALPLLLKLETELHALKENRFWNVQQLAIELNSMFSAIAHRWILPEPTNPVREKLQIFNQMLASQERILHLLESTNSPENVVKQNETDVVPLTRHLRRTFQNCASIHQVINSSFSLQKTDSGKPLLPRVLAPFWNELTMNLQISVKDFQTISLHDSPPLELLQDQYTLQLQIYDQIAELAQIANGLTPEMGTFVKNANFENRVTNSRKSGEESEGNEPTETPNEKEETEVLPADVLILISMQSAILDRTKEMVQQTEMSSEEKAGEIGFLATQEQKIVECAKALGFDATPNSTFDSILAQMNQASFLLEKQDLGEMTVSIQEEILYGLHSVLQQNETPENKQESDSQKTSASESDSVEDLSLNSDSQAPSKEGTDESDETDENDATAENPVSQEENPQEKLAGREPSEVELLQNSYWGELPLRQRELLRLLPTEEPVPGYEKTLELYYRKLHEDE